MEVSNEIKEDIRKTQSDLRNAIRIHQVWVARLQEDESNDIYKCKVKDAEKEIIAVSQTQKRVVERLRKELENYQQRLKLRNKEVNADNDNRYVAQQLRDHQLQHISRKRTTSLLKPSVLTEIHIRTENTNGDLKPSSNDASDSETKLSEPSEGKENGNGNGSDTGKSQFSVHDSRNNFANVLNKVKETFMGGKLQSEVEPWRQAPGGSDSDASLADLSPTPSPPSPPHSPHAVSQETFLRFLGLITPRQKEALERKRSERRKRCTTSTNRNEFVYDNFDMQPKRKKNQFPYLQTCTPPQTRSQRLRRQQQGSSRDPSPPTPTPGAENKGAWGSGEGAAWLAALPAGLTAEPVGDSQPCAGCGRDDVPSLLVWCAACGVRLHTGCGVGGCCPSCRAPLPAPPTHTGAAPYAHTYRDKVSERRRLRQRNVQLCAELAKLEARAASLQLNLQQHTDEKRALLAAQIETQRHLQKLLDVMGRFKDTPDGVRSPSSDDSSERSGSRDE